jgi:hypothetical protein
MRANERADKGRDREGTEEGEYNFNRNGSCGQTSKHGPIARQFPPVVRPRFRGLRFAAAEDWSALETVGDAVSPPPPLRFSVAFAIEGVDDPAGAEAAGLGAFACCGVPFGLSGDDAGEDVDGALCGIVAGGMWADDGAVDGKLGVYNVCAAPRLSGGNCP